MEPKGTLQAWSKSDIRKAYKEIQDHLAKIRGANQLLESRYRQYYRRDPLRDKELSEFGFLAKNLYTRFGQLLQGMEVKGTEKDKEEVSEVCDPSAPFQWFHSSENQDILQRILRSLYALEYNTPLGPETKKRRIIHDRQRSLSLFVLSGEEGFVEALQSRMHVREYDIKERYAKGELRGALTHLRQISAAEVEGVIRRLVGSHEVPEFKCLLFFIQSQADLEKETLRAWDTILKGMMRGELKTLAV
ncbi:MAG: hypothetical protein H6Q55_3458 [Deltaproteobacteria bacterium]|nr:hypothetical protein [Deltaproteobacteria bacterium]